MAAAVTKQDARHEGDAAAQSSLTPGAIFARAAPSVVRVVAPDNRKGGTVSNGSGFLVSTRGLIATNYHVVRDADSASVVLSDKTELPVLGVAALDKNADLAILKVASQIPAQPLELAGGDLPPVGTRVYVIGHPGGFVNTLSDGLVSGHREKGTVPYFPRMPTMIQTTAPTSKGSSGGPWLTADGKVVGVHTIGFKEEGENLNLAVPASHVARLLRQCDTESPLTLFPMAREPLVELSKAADGWSPEDLRNAAHFGSALRASDEAWALCRKPPRPWRPGDPPEILGQSGQPINKTGRPWLLDEGDLQEFVRLLREATREARMVRKDVLWRIHVLLPEAFDDFITSTEYISSHARTSRPDPYYVAMWRRWTAWRTANGRALSVP